MGALSFGVLGTAKIARTTVVPAFQKAEGLAVTAMASRDAGHAEEAAEALGLPHAFGSYEALLASDAVEAVYIPLPNHRHVEWTLRALEAGKHVLCEKPLGLDAAEARRVVEDAQARPGLKVMEGFMYRFHPQWARARRLIEDGALGPLRLVESRFTYFKRDPGNIRNQPEAGGGALMDVGCYCVSVARWLFGGAPQRVLASQDVDPDFGVDRRTTGLLDFGAGVSTFTCATQLAGGQHVALHGERGRLEVPVPFTPAADAPARLLLTTGDATEEHVVDPADQFTLQGEQFARAVRDDTPVPTPLGDAVENMRVLDALRQSAQEAGWVAC